MEGKEGREREGGEGKGRRRGKGKEWRERKGGRGVRLPLSKFLDPPLHPTDAGGFLLDFPAEVMQRYRSTATDPAEVLLTSFISRWRKCALLSALLVLSWRFTKFSYLLTTESG